jgi:uncharacterized protein YbjQ (UPF0145 family)
MSSEPTEEQERENEESLARIERGGITLAAERRLSELRRDGRRDFTSDLSVAEFALGHQLGLEPISQVMGSCIYQVGWQYAPGVWNNLEGAALEELDVVTQAWNEARSRALSRMAQEAQLAGADAVVGVRLRQGEHDWAAGAVDFVVVGTAVRVPHASPAAPILSDLSVQDYWKLCQAGVEPRGLVAATSCFFIRRGVMARGMQMLTFASNQEIPEYTQGIYAARETALARLSQQAAQAGATGIVGVRIDHTIGEQEIKGGIGEGGVRGLVVTLHLVGTGVSDANRDSMPTPEFQIGLNDPGESA